MSVRSIAVRVSRGQTLSRRATGAAAGARTRAPDLGPAPPRLSVARAARTCLLSKRRRQRARRPKSADCRTSFGSKPRRAPVIQPDPRAAAAPRRASPNLASLRRVRSRYRQDTLGSARADVTLAVCSAISWQATLRTPRGFMARPRFHCRIYEATNAGYAVSGNHSAPRDRQFAAPAFLWASLTGNEAASTGSETHRDARRGRMRPE